jgi:hypothetical protein
MRRILAWGLTIALAIGTAAPTIEAVTTACERAPAPTGSGCCCAPSDVPACGENPPPVTSAAGACCEIAIVADPSAGIVPATPGLPALGNHASLIAIEPAAPVLPAIGDEHRVYDASSPPHPSARPLYSRIALLLI